MERNEERTIYKKNHSSRNNRISYRHHYFLVRWILGSTTYFFGASPSPINYFESIFETTLISVIAIIIIVITHLLLQRLNFLEGILPVCSFCKKIRIKKQWVPIERYIRDRSEADFSHSVCPECSEQHYAIQLKWKKLWSLSNFLRI